MCDCCSQNHFTVWKLPFCDESFFSLNAYSLCFIWLYLKKVSFTITEYFYRHVMNIAILWNYVIQYRVELFCFVFLGYFLVCVIFLLCSKLHFCISIPHGLLLRWRSSCQTREYIAMDIWKCYVLLQKILRPKQNGRHFAYGICKFNLQIDSFLILIQMSLKFSPDGLLW